MRLGFRRGGLRLGLLGMLVGSVMLTLLVGSSAAAPVCSAGTCTETFNFTGAEQTFTVPAGVTSVTIHAVGAPGANGPAYAGTPSNAGSGASVTATVPLPAGTTTLYVEVGGAGIGSSLGCDGGGRAFNGGSGTTCGGGGGGASDVRTTSLGTVPNPALTAANDSRLVVAGGGGGGAGSYGCGEAGGTAGDTSATGAGDGSAGYDDYNLCGGVEPGTPGGNGGLGGAQGGAGGAGTASNPTPGDPGSRGVGGDAPLGVYNQGGGGGGGYFGGGGGGDGFYGGGGGAGSSYWVATATSTSMSEDTTGTPSVTITYTEPVSYTFTGFFNPVANPPLINFVKAGSGVALKFSLAGNQGLNIFAAGYPASVALDPSCLSVGAVPQPTSPAGNSGLSYNPTTDTYSYNWKTQKSWKGTCRQLVVGLNDGTLHYAYFKFK
jgi:hypothetical protein